ncbi:hypothetical protein PRIPAC_77847 [Pristionchus pacificus]|uniref:glutathione transferase n=1 Tax=Pristionchus pacificus TaxID=54126 RepID=A0A454XTV6_PRIPA|nr:hypothetical protein PRIPAC_77847 [Pristionchus pacificus]|eukprot:PDM73026.1 Glutathione S-transferase [Pristionchus pacificus]
MPSYKLNYFDARGLGEVSRQIFILSGTPYEDNRIPRDQWPALKDKTPFGTLPVLEVDGKQIPQSLAIARYLAKEFGFYGKTPFEAAWVDALADQVKDFLAEMRPYFAVAMGMVEGDKEKLKAEVALPAIEKHFGLLEKAAKNNGNNGHFVGSSLTFVDLLIADFINSVEGLVPGFTAPYPAVSAVKTKIDNLPKIKEWIEKRPKTVT